MKKANPIGRKYEISALSAGRTCVIGVDEAGRGPLAGPVVAAACFVPIDIEIEGIQDSKTVSEEDRERVYEILMGTAGVQYASAIRSVEYIDEHNILAATLDAMAECALEVRNKVSKLEASLPLVAIDGNRLPPKLKGSSSVDVETVVKGDSKVFSIAAASIIAKVVRDRMMFELDSLYPGFDLKQNKGYPTPGHKRLVAKLGPTPHHRLSFAPIEGLLREGKVALPAGREMPPDKKAKKEAANKRRLAQKAEKMLEDEKRLSTSEQDEKRPAAATKRKRRKMKENNPNQENEAQPTELGSVDDELAAPLDHDEQQLGDRKRQRRQSDDDDQEVPVAARETSFLKEWLNRTA